MEATTTNRIIVSPKSPPRRNGKIVADDSYSDFNYWKMPLPIIDDL